MCPVALLFAADVGFTLAGRAGALMQYRLVYDVLNDGPPWLGVVGVVILLLLASAALLEMVERMRARPRSWIRVPGRLMLEDTPFVVVAVLGLLMVFLAVLLGTYTYNALALQRDCQDWVRSGQYQTTEGTIAHYHFRKAGSSFQVDGRSFDLLQVSAGFGGQFNFSGAPPGGLDEGMRVRLAHREGHILRVEIATEARGSR